MSGEVKTQTLKSSEILVKDKSGALKVYADGKLSDLNEYAVSGPKENATSTPTNQALTVPRFTDLVVAPNDEHFIENKGDEKKGSKSDFHFHPGDQEDLEKELQKAYSLFQLNAQKQYSIQKIADKLVINHKLSLTADQSARFTALLLSFFRQTRSATQIRNVLQGDKKSEGFGLSESIVDSILVIIRQLRDKIEKVDGVVIDEVKTPAPVVAPPPKPVEPPKPKPAPVMPSLPKKVAPVVAPPPKPVEPPKPKPAPVVPPKPVVPSPPKPKPVEVTKAPPVKPDTSWSSIQRPSSDSDQPKMQDVATPKKKKGSKLTGKVDELAYMDLDTFRMLDPDPRIRVGKILGKIQTLEKESLTRKAQGVDAWRNNAIYKHYLNLGQKSLEQKKNIEDVIKDMGSSGQDSLTLDEFEAISDLNKMLRF